MNAWDFTFLAVRILALISLVVPLDALEIIDNDILRKTAFDTIEERETVKDITELVLAQTDLSEDEKSKLVQLIQTGVFETKRLGS